LTSGRLKILAVVVSGLQLDVDNVPIAGWILRVLDEGPELGLGLLYPRQPECTLKDDVRFGAYTADECILQKFYPRNEQLTDMPLYPTTTTTRYR